MASKIEILEAIGAPEGTRTHTLKAREPKYRMSTNSITGADMSGREPCRYFVVLCFHTARITLNPRL